MYSDTDLDIGSVLLDKKLINTDQLQECIKLHKQKGGYLSQHLIESGCIKDSDLTTCLTCQYGYCYIPLGSYFIEDSALGAIPENCVYDYCVIPIEKNDKILTLVMADPLNKGVIDMLRRRSQCEVVIFVSSRSEIKQAIERYYGKTFRTFNMDKFNDDTILRDDFVKKEISNQLYMGPNRRRYRRLYVEMEMEYYDYPNTVKTKATNISMSGLLFESNIAIPKGKQMTARLSLPENTSITGVVEVARCESTNMANTVFGDDSQAFYFYEVGAYFTFLDKNNQMTLADFLRRKLNFN